MRKTVFVKVSFVAAPFGGGLRSGFLKTVECDSVERYDDEKR